MDCKDTPDEQFGVTLHSNIEEIMATVKRLRAQLGVLAGPKANLAKEVCKVITAL